MIPKYYEFLNKIKILSGYQALENIPYELKIRGACRPMIITQQDAVEQGILKIFFAAVNGSDLVTGRVVQCAKPITSQSVEQALSDFKASACNSIIAIGSGAAFELGNAVSCALSQESEDDILLMGTDYKRKSYPAPFVIVPMANSGLELAGDPDIVVLDPRMTLNITPRTIILSAIDTICHAIETYTCLQKNPISDAYAFSAITLIRENLANAIKFPKNTKARHGLGNAALLSSIALKNSKAGIAHALADGLEESNNIAHEEAMGIILPTCMDTNMINLDEYYGELLLPMSGPEIYADTPNPERGRKTVQTIRNMLSEYHQRYDIPVCLSEVGVKRSNFENITALCLKSSHLLYNPIDVTKEDIQNILNMSF